MSAVAHAFNLPTGYSWTFGRWQERRRESSQAEDAVAGLGHVGAATGRWLRRAC